MESDNKAEEVKPNAEADLVEGRANGTDETGAPAPNQHDQVEINNEKKVNPDLRDPRWPAGTQPKAIAAEGEQAEKMNQAFEEKRKAAAEEAADRQPTMGAPTDASRQEGSVADQETAGSK
jgi:hypothetical protein